MPDSWTVKNDWDVLPRSVHKAILVLIGISAGLTVGLWQSWPALAMLAIGMVVGMASWSSRANPNEQVKVAWRMFCAMVLLWFIAFLVMWGLHTIALLA